MKKVKPTLIERVVLVSDEIHTPLPPFLSSCSFASRSETLSFRYPPLIMLYSLLLRLSKFEFVVASVLTSLFFAASSRQLCIYLWPTVLCYDTFVTSAFLLLFSYS